MTDFGDRRCLAQQSQRVEPALIDRYCARTPGCLGDPRKLMLELAHELFDANRRRKRLFVLNASERCFALLIRKVKPDHAAHDEGAAHQDDERYRVLEEQATSTQQAILRSNR